MRYKYCILLRQGIDQIYNPLCENCKPVLILYLIYIVKIKNFFTKAIRYNSSLVKFPFAEGCLAMVALLDLVVKMSLLHLHLKWTGKKNIRNNDSLSSQ